MPVGAGGQGFVGEREAAGDEVGEQAADVGRASQRAVAAGLGAAARASVSGRRAGVTGVPKISVMAWVTAQGWQRRRPARLPS